MTLLNLFIIKASGYLLTGMGHRVDPNPSNIPHDGENIKRADFYICLSKPEDEEKAPDKRIQ